MEDKTRRTIFALLRLLGVKEWGPLVEKCSGGRVELLRLMDEREAGNLIGYLNAEKQKRNRQRRLILSLGYQLGWIEKTQAQPDFSKIIDFGINKLRWEQKPVAHYTSIELSKLITVLEQILIKDISHG